MFKYLVNTLSQDGIAHKEVRVFKQKTWRLPCAFSFFALWMVGFVLCVGVTSFPALAQEENLDPFDPTIDETTARYVELRDVKIPALERQMKVTERRINQRVEEKINAATRDDQPAIPADVMKNLELLSNLIESGALEGIGSESGTTGDAGEGGALGALVPKDKVAYSNEGRNILVSDIEDATFVGCINGKAMFRSPDGRAFFVPIENGFSNETLRLVGGCKP